MPDDTVQRAFAETKEPDRRALIRGYKETPRPLGVFRVRNIAQGRSLIGTSTDLPAILNRQRFQLSNGLHPDRDLQRDWNEQGAKAFTLEVVDQLKPKEEEGYDPTEDLGVLLEMWRERLVASGESLYGGGRGRPGARTREGRTEPAP